MEEWFKWGAGLALAVILAGLGYLVNAMKELRTSLTDGDDKNAQKIGDVSRAAHARIDEVHRDYVRRDDFREYKVENRETLKRIEEKLDDALRTKSG